jgi:hypothetical protein
VKYGRANNNIKHKENNIKHLENNIKHLGLNKDELNVLEQIKGINL